MKVDGFYVFCLHRAGCIPAFNYSLAKELGKKLGFQEQSMLLTHYMPTSLRALRSDKKSPWRGGKMSIAIPSLNHVALAFYVIHFIIVTFKFIEVDFVLFLEKVWRNLHAQCYFSWKHYALLEEMWLSLVQEQDLP